MQKSDHKEDNVEKVSALMKTNHGDIAIELFVKECPETVWNFINLAEGRQECNRKGPFFDGLIFHRVIDGFMIQGGCPEGTGMGGPGYRFADECSSAHRHDGPGVLSMANAGPNTNGSQFFITLTATPHLDGRHTVFGKVTEGLNVVQEIGKTTTGPNDRPVEDVIINSVTINRQ